MNVWEGEDNLTTEINYRSFSVFCVIDNPTRDDAKAKLCAGVLWEEVFLSNNNNNNSNIEIPLPQLHRGDHPADQEKVTVYIYLPREGEDSLTTEIDY